MLYGIDLAKAAIAKAGRAVVVEGYTDVLALHQAGIEEAVGVMGTAITDEQVAALSGMVEEVVLALDADSAGQEAMLRAQRVAAGRKMRLRVAAMPKGVDPAEMIAAEGGSERFRGPGRGRCRPSRLPGRAGSGSRRRLLSDRARPGALGGRPDPCGNGRDGKSRRPGAPPGGAARLGARDGDGSGGGGAAGDGRFRGTDPIAKGGAHLRAGSVRLAAELTSRERRERALLAMCVALPGEGSEYLARLTDEHLSPLGARAAAWLREHPEDPASNLPREDDELAGLIAELMILAHDEPASAEAMELNFLLLEQRRLEGKITAAGEKGERERRAALSRERAALVERIARTERVWS